MTVRKRMYYNGPQDKQKPAKFNRKAKGGTFMKINQKVLCIPPYISTAWENVQSLEHDSRTLELNVSLRCGKTVKVPKIGKDLMEKIFAVHAHFCESKTHRDPSTSPPSSPFHFSLPLQGNLDNMTSMMQHNPQQKNAPNLPEEVLMKLSAVIKTLGTEADIQSLPKAEPHCNCFYCQIAHVLHGEHMGRDQENTPEERISEEDLSFREWDIKQEGDHLYVVTNPMDKEEYYHVYLGDPVGCTCGQKKCEHVRSVLKSYI